MYNDPAKKTSKKKLALRHQLKVYLDTSVLLSLLLSYDKHHDTTVKIFSAARKIDCQLILSDLTLLEVSSLYSRLRDPEQKRFTKELTRLLGRRELVHAQTTLEPSSVLTTPVVGERDISFEDRLHVVAARQLGCQMMLTLDLHFLRIDSKWLQFKVLTPTEFIVLGKRG